MVSTSFFSSANYKVKLFPNTIPSDLAIGFAALTFDNLGIAPHKLRGYPVEYLISYRKGGPQFGSTVSERVSPDSFP